MIRWVAPAENGNDENQMEKLELKIQQQRQRTPWMGSAIAFCLLRKELEVGQ